MIENNVVLKVENLNFSYRINNDDLAIKDVSFSIKKGEYVALVGHNGSGKSTIAKILMGLLVADENSKITIFDMELNDENLYKIRKDLGIIFQNPDNQFIGSTVQEDIAFGLENNCVPNSKMQDIIDDYAKKVGMEKYLDKSPSLLSGGQKQRVSIAGVLARNPKIFIMDEATSMLDPKGKQEILNLIYSLKRANSELTVISITHDIQEAYQANHVIVLDDGKKVLDGSPKEVFKNRDLLLKYRLDIPFYLELDTQLALRGIDVKGASCLEELVDRLCK